MEYSEKTVEILNDLVQINNDRIRGYERATVETTDDTRGLRDLFTSFIGDSHKFKLAIATEIQTYGKDIENTTSNSGDLHRTWLNVKAFFSGHNPKSVLEECEFGEDAILKAYRTAIADEHLPAYLKEMLSEQELTLKAAHDKIKELRDSQ